MDAGRVCVLKDHTIDVAIYVTNSALAFAVISGIATNFVSATTNPNFWNIFNFMQIIEIISLLELQYPERLE